MMPTLLAGDFILVNKYVYGLRLPVVNMKFFDISEPQRGDIVVFRYPRDPSIDYIKRVIGLPGDRIEYINKTLYVNGEKAEQEARGMYLGTGAGRSMNGAKLLEEQLGTVDHEILTMGNRSSVEGEFRVPEGHYFVMGDNRDNSNDSRYWGMVPEKNLVGKAFMIWMNWDSSAGGITWSRIGSRIK
jgi:signal peptidase I